MKKRLCCCWAGKGESGDSRARFVVLVTTQVTWGFWWNAGRVRCRADSLLRGHHLLCELQSGPLCAEGGQQCPPTFVPCDLSCCVLMTGRWLLSRPSGPYAESVRVQGREIHPSALCPQTDTLSCRE